MRFAFWRRPQPVQPPTTPAVEVDDRPDPDVQLRLARARAQQLEFMHTEMKRLAEQAAARRQENHISEAVEAWFGSSRTPRTRHRMPPRRSA